jgi:hypothetical protein
MCKPYKTEKIYGGRVEWRKIQAWQARNWDGEYANFQKGTPDRHRWLIEKRFVSDDGERIRFTNCW